MKKEHIFILHLYDIVSVVLKMGTGNASGTILTEIQELIKGLDDEARAVVAGVDFDAKVKLERRVRKVTEARFQEFLNMSSGMYEPERVVMTIFHFLENLTEKDYIVLPDTSYLTKSVNFLVEIINVEYNQGENSSQVRIDSRLSKAEKRAKHWLYLYENQNYI